VKEPGDLGTLSTTLTPRLLSPPFYHKKQRTRALAWSYFTAYITDTLTGQYSKNASGAAPGAQGAPGVEDNENVRRANDTSLRTDTTRKTTAR
jgi:hypothetical protein